MRKAKWFRGMVALVLALSIVGGLLLSCGGKKDEEPRDSGGSLGSGGAAPNEEDTPSDQSALTLSFPQVEAKPGGKATFEISLSNNTGIGGFQFRASFDHDVFAFESGRVVIEDNAYSGCTERDGNAFLFWTSTTPYTDSGVIAEVTLTVASDAKRGVYPLSAVFVEGEDSFYRLEENGEMPDIPVRVVDGSITVK